MHNTIVLCPKRSFVVRSLETHDNRFPSETKHYRSPIEANHYCSSSEAYHNGFKSFFLSVFIFVITKINTKNTTITKYSIPVTTLLILSSPLMSFLSSSFEAHYCSSRSAAMCPPLLFSVYNPLLQFSTIMKPTTVFSIHLNPTAVVLRLHPQLSF